MSKNENIFMKRAHTDELSDIEASGDEFDDNDDMDTEQKKVTQEFQEVVVKFVNLDDLIRKKKEELKELEKHKKPCEEYILKGLDQIGENVIDITNGKLRKNKSETKVPLNQDIIKQAIFEKVKDPKDVVAIIHRMDELRPKKTRVNLKRTMGRKK